MYCDNIHTVYRRIALLDISSLMGAKHHHEHSVLDVGVSYCYCELNNNTSVISCHTGPLRPRHEFASETRKQTNKVLAPPPPTDQC